MVLFQKAPTLNIESHAVILQNFNVHRMRFKCDYCDAVLRSRDYFYFLYKNISIIRTLRTAQSFRQNVKNNTRLVKELITFYLPLANICFTSLVKTKNTFYSTVTVKTFWYIFNFDVFMIRKSMYQILSYIIWICFLRLLLYLFFKRNF